MEPAIEAAGSWEEIAMDAGFAALPPAPEQINTRSTCGEPAVNISILSIGREGRDSEPGIHRFTVATGYFASNLCF